MNQPPAGTASASAIQWAWLGWFASLALLSGMAYARSASNPDPSSDRLGAGLTFLLACFLSGWVLVVGNTVFLIDDSFYYLQIAQNLYHLHWSTFDQIGTTNGYHPLWMMILVAIEVLADLLRPDDPFFILRLAQAASVMLLSGIVTLLFLHLRRFLSVSSAMVFSLGFLAFPLTFPVHLSLMESALVLGLLLLSNYLYGHNARHARTGSFVAMALLIVARIETGLLWSALLLLRALDEGLERRRAGHPQAMASQAKTWLLCTLTGIGFTVAYNYAVCGMPTSYAGTLKLGWVAQQYDEFLAFLPLRKCFSTVMAALNWTVLEFPGTIAISLSSLLKWGLQENEVLSLYSVITLLPLIGLLSALARKRRECLQFFERIDLGLFAGFAILLTFTYKILMFVHTSVMFRGADFQQFYYHHSLNLLVYLALASLFVRPSMLIHPPLPSAEKADMPLAIPTPLRGWGETPVLCLWIGMVVLGGLLSQVYTNGNFPLEGSAPQDLILETRKSGVGIEAVWHPNGGRDGFVLSKQGIKVVNGDGLANSRDYIEAGKKDGEYAPYLREKGCTHFIGTHRTPQWVNITHPYPVCRDDTRAVLIRKGAPPYALYRLKD